MVPSKQLIIYFCMQFSLAHLILDNYLDNFRPSRVYSNTIMDFIFISQASYSICQFTSRVNFIIVNLAHDDDCWTQSKACALEMKTLIVLLATLLDIRFIKEAPLHSVLSRWVNSRHNKNRLGGCGTYFMWRRHALIPNSF